MDERWPKTVPLSLQATVRRAVEAPEATLLLPAAPGPEKRAREVRNALDYVNTLPPDARVALVKHSRMVDRNHKLNVKSGEAVQYYRHHGFEPRHTTEPRGQYDMLDPGPTVPVIQDPSCWSCQPHFSDEEYILLRGAALKQQLAAAGHPLPAPQLAPLPPPFNPTVEHEQRSYLGPLPLQEVHQEQLLQQHQALLQAHAGHVRATKVQPEPQQELEADQGCWPCCGRRNRVRPQAAAATAPQLLPEPLAPPPSMQSQPVQDLSPYQYSMHAPGAATVPYANMSAGGAPGVAGLGYQAHQLAQQQHQAQVPLQPHLEQPVQQPQQPLQMQQQGAGFQQGMGHMPAQQPHLPMQAQHQQHQQQSGVAGGDAEQQQQLHAGQHSTHPAGDMQQQHAPPHIINTTTPSAQPGASVQAFAPSAQHQLSQSSTGPAQTSGAHGGTPPGGPLSGNVPGGLLQQQQFGVQPQQPDVQQQQSGVQQQQPGVHQQQSGVQPQQLGLQQQQSGVQQQQLGLQQQQSGVQQQQPGVHQQQSGVQQQQLGLQQQQSGVQQQQLGLQQQQSGVLQQQPGVHQQQSGVQPQQPGLQQQQSGVQQQQLGLQQQQSGVQPQQPGVHQQQQAAAVVQQTAGGFGAQGQNVSSAPSTTGFPMQDPSTQGSAHRQGIEAGQATGIALTQGAGMDTQQQQQQQAVQLQQQVEQEAGGAKGGFFSRMLGRNKQQAPEQATQYPQHAVPTQQGSAAIAQQQQPQQQQQQQPGGAKGGFFSRMLGRAKPALEQEQQQQQQQPAGGGAPGQLSGSTWTQEQSAAQQATGQQAGQVGYPSVLPAQAQQPAGLAQPQQQQFQQQQPAGLAQQQPLQQQQQPAGLVQHPQQQQPQQQQGLGAAQAHQGPVMQQAQVAGAGAASQSSAPTPAQSPATGFTQVPQAAQAPQEMQGPPGTGVSGAGAAAPTSSAVAGRSPQMEVIDDVDDVSVAD